MSELNSDTYRAADVVRWYDSLKEITPVEKSIFEKYSSLLKNGKILDIGIGGGRTTEFLLPKCSSYTGIDYSNEFVQLCKKKFPNADIRLADARDLREFGDNIFDLVNFSFNGIDYVDAGGRKKILSEINRVLKKDGIFFFSSHNLLHPTFNTMPWQRKNESFFYNLKTFLKFSPYLIRKWKNKKAEVFANGYAIINDHAHDFRLLTFHASPDHIRRQLNENGFYGEVFYNRQGKNCDDKDLEEWIFVTCSKK